MIFKTKDFYKQKKGSSQIQVASGNLLRVYTSLLTPSVVAGNQIYEPSSHPTLSALLFYPPQILKLWLILCNTIILTQKTDGAPRVHGLLHPLPTVRPEWPSPLSVPALTDPRSDPIHGPPISYIAHANISNRGFLHSDTGEQSNSSPSCEHQLSTHITNTTVEATGGL